jgi:hypothetical protein
MPIVLDTTFIALKAEEGRGLGAKGEEKGIRKTKVSRRQRMRGIEVGDALSQYLCVRLELLARDAETFIGAGQYTEKQLYNFD